MFPVEAFHDSVVRIHDVLTRLGIRYHIVGGAASIAYTQPRATQDIDLVVDPVMLKSRLMEFVAAVQAADFSLHVPSVQDAVRLARSFQLMDERQVLRLDLYPRELIPGELSRSVQFELFVGVRVPVVSLPDLLLAKLIWVSMGSHRSRREVCWLYRKLSATAQASVTEFAATHELSALLQEVLAEPEEPQG